MVGATILGVGVWYSQNHRSALVEFTNNQAWDEYTDKYGFSLKYPPEFTIESAGGEQVYIRNQDSSISISIRIEAYDLAPDKGHYLLSKSDLLQLKKEISNSTSTSIVSGIPMRISYRYLDGYLARAEFFVGNNYVDMYIPVTRDDHDAMSQAGIKPPLQFLDGRPNSGLPYQVQVKVNIFERILQTINLHSR